MVRILLFFYVLLNVVPAFCGNPEGERDSVVASFPAVFQDKSKEELIQLSDRNAQAKLAYEHLYTHPKLLAKDADLTRWTSNREEILLLRLSFDAQKIEFNSLFVQQFVEHSAILYFRFSLKEAIVIADKKRLDVQGFIDQLNAVSLTPVSAEELVIKN